MRSAPVLTRWGLPPDADLLYRALFQFGESTAGALAALLGITRRRVDLSLVALHDAGAVQVAGGSRTRRWKAAEPERVIAHLQRKHLNRQANAPRRRQIVGLGEDVSHLITREAARHRLARLIAVMRQEFLAMSPDRVFDNESMAAAAPQSKIMAKRGVPVRELGVQEHQPDLLVAYGGTFGVGEYRRMPDPPMKLVVVDRRVALFPVDPHDYDRGYLELHQAPVVESLVATFEKHWQQSSTPTVGYPMSPTLSAREQALLQLLAAGHTDGTAARQLCISERTVSATMRSLMDRLGVDNRFQLGLVLGSAQAVALPPREAEPDR